MFAWSDLLVFVGVTGTSYLVLMWVVSRPRRSELSVEFDTQNRELSENCRYGQTFDEGLQSIRPESKQGPQDVAVVDDHQEAMDLSNDDLTTGSLMEESNPFDDGLIMEDPAPSFEDFEPFGKAA